MSTSVVPFTAVRVGMEGEDQGNAGTVFLPYQQAPVSISDWKWASGVVCVSYGHQEFFVRGTARGVADSLGLAVRER